MEKLIGRMDELHPEREERVALWTGSVARRWNQRMAGKKEDDIENPHAVGGGEAWRF